MTVQNKIQNTYLDVIFEGRNKAYGSYVLRSTYAERMQRAGAFMLLLCALIIGYVFVSNRLQHKINLIQPILPLTMDTIAFTNVTIELPKPPVEIAPPPAAAKVKTAVYTAPEIVRNDQIKPELKLATQDELKTAVAGVSNQEGATGGNTSISGDKKGGSGGVEIEGSKGDAKSEIVNFAEVEPEFPGGKSALYAYLAEHVQYPSAALNAGKEGKVLVRFVINEDGSVSNVMVVRGFGYGSEAEAQKVINGMPRWRAGRNNNHPVKVWFQVPIFFKLN